jgi:ribosomal 50S subunit-associated protein YjgA (DUF615 family)
MSGRRVTSLIKKLGMRARGSETVRRALMPLMIRFPSLRRRLAALAQRRVRDIVHPDWPAPLPAAYLHLPLSTRKVLLDLARAAQEEERRG